MSQQSVWDDPSIQSGNFYSFKDVAPGTTVSGVIVDITTQPFTDNGVTKTVPVLKLRDDITGEECSLTAGAYRLKNELVEKRPNVGDHLRVTQTGSEPIGGGKFAKNWQVVITPPGTPATVAAPAALPINQGQAYVAPVPAAAATVPADTQAALAALNNLAPEERARLGLPPPVPA